MAKINLLLGEVFHKRFRPKENEFKYQSLYVAFDLENKNQLKNSLFSLNKFNLFSFYDKDHGKGEANCFAWIKEILTKNNLENIDKIILVTHPRILGYVFNPISFWLCYSNSSLIAVLAEVNNTFGQRHSYLLYNSNLRPINSSDQFESNKEFHVSPFFDLEGKYQFRFAIDDKKMDFFITYLVDSKTELVTYLKCKRLEFNSKNLFFFFLKIPFATFKTIILIHYQALKLFFKKAKFHKLTSNPKSEISVWKNAKK